MKPGRTRGRIFTASRSSWASQSAASRRSVVDVRTNTVPCSPVSADGRPRVASGATAPRDACARLKDAAGSELTFQAYAEENLRWDGGGDGGALLEGHMGGSPLIIIISSSVIICAI